MLNKFIMYVHNLAPLMSQRDHTWFRVCSVSRVSTTAPWMAPWAAPCALWASSSAACTISAFCFSPSARLLGKRGNQGLQISGPSAKDGGQGWGQTVPSVHPAVAAPPDAHLLQFAPGLCPHPPGSGPALQLRRPGAGSVQVMLGWRALAPVWPPSQCYQDQLPPLRGHRQELRGTFSSMGMGTVLRYRLRDYTWDMGLLIGIRM